MYGAFFQGVVPDPNTITTLNKFIITINPLKERSKPMKRTMTPVLSELDRDALIEKFRLACSRAHIVGSVRRKRILDVIPLCKRGRLSRRWYPLKKG